MLIRPNHFYSFDLESIQNRISNSIWIFRYFECQTEKIPILIANDKKAEKIQINTDSQYTVVDIIDQQKEIFRQIIDLTNQHVLAEIKMKLVGKTKLKGSEDSYSPLYTVDKYKHQNLVTCLEEDYIVSYSNKAIMLSSLFSVNFKEQEEISVLLIGGSSGIIPYFMERVYGKYINITVLDTDDTLKSLGQKYFGFKDSAKQSWNFIKDISIASIEALSSLKKESFNFIILNQTLFGKEAALSPDKSFLENENLSIMSSYLKDNGLLLLNIIYGSVDIYSNIIKNIKALL